MNYEYLLIYIGKNGLGRVNMTLDRPITDTQTLTDLDNLLKNQENELGEKDETIFVINYKLLKSYNI